MKNVVITIAPDYSAAMEPVVEALREHGMQVDQVLPEVGIISGRATDDQSLSNLYVEGVASVEEGMHFQLPPPESPVQ
jgi:hypothetical protein